MKKLKYISYFEDYKKLKSNLFDSKKYFKDSDDYKILYIEDKNGNKITPNEAENSANYEDKFIDMTEYMKIGLLYNEKEITLKLAPMADKENVSFFEDPIQQFFLEDSDILEFYFDDVYDTDTDVFNYDYDTGEILYYVSHGKKIISKFNDYRKKYYNETYPYILEDIKQFIEEDRLLFPINNTDYEKEIIQNLINNENFINDLSKFITNITMNILLYVIIKGYILKDYYNESEYFYYNGPAPYITSDTRYQFY